MKSGTKTQGTYERSGYSVPTVVYEDMKEDATRLIDELHKWNLRCTLSQELSHLVRTASNMGSGMFVIDVDMGENRHTEGITAIERLRSIARRYPNRAFFIVALTSHENYKQEASAAGVDAFILKRSTETDALELVTRLHGHAIEVEKRLALNPQTRLATREYKELERQLKNARKGLEYGLSRSIETVCRALDWPFLLPNEQLILSALDRQLRSMQESSRLNKKILKLCLDGVMLLAEDRAKDDKRVTRWIERAREQSPEFLFSWLNEEDFDVNGAEESIE